MNTIITRSGLEGHFNRDRDPGSRTCLTTDIKAQHPLAEGDFIYRVNIKEQRPAIYKLIGVGHFTGLEDTVSIPAFQLQEKGRIITYLIPSVRDMFPSEEDAIAELQRLKELDRIPRTQTTITIEEKLLVDAYRVLNEDSRLDKFEELGRGSTRDGLLQHLLQQYVTGKV